MITYKTILITILVFIAIAIAVPLVHEWLLKMWRS